MSQREVAIVGKNNTKAAVTGQEELLVKVNSFGGNGAVRTPGIVRYSGTVDTILQKTNSIAFSSVGSGNVVVNGTILKPGETINFDAGDINNYFPENAFTVDSTSGEVLIIYIY